MKNMILEFIFWRTGIIIPNSDIIFANYQCFVWQIVSVNKN